MSNARLSHSQISVPILVHSNWSKKCWSDKKNVERWDMQENGICLLHVVIMIKCKYIHQNVHAYGIFHYTPSLIVKIIQIISFTFLRFLWTDSVEIAMGNIFCPSVNINSKINYATLECILKMLEEFNYILYPLCISTNLYDAQPNVIDFAEAAF